MEGFFTALASAGVIVVIIGILATITPYLFMYFMYKQMKQLQNKLDTIINCISKPTSSDQGSKPNDSSEYIDPFEKYSITTIPDKDK